MLHRLRAYVPLVVLHVDALLLLDEVKHEVEFEAALTVILCVFVRPQFHHFEVVKVGLLLGV